MDCIFLAFNAEGFNKKEQALEVMCQRIERVFSVKILAMHDKSQKVLFGERILKMVNAAQAKKKGKK